MNDVIQAMAEMYVMAEILIPMAGGGGLAAFLGYLLSMPRKY